MIVVAVGPVGKSPEEEVVLTCVAQCGTMHGQSSSAVCGGGTRQQQLVVLEKGCHTNTTHSPPLVGAVLGFSRDEVALALRVNAHHRHAFSGLV